jgi:RND family efflux transporter MFP subunit
MMKPLRILSLLLLPLAALAEPLTTAPVERAEVSREAKLDSLVEAINQTTISAQTGGQVEEIFFDVDDVVKKGDLILRLRDNEQKAQLGLAEATLAEARAALKNRRDEYNRVKDLYQKKLASQSEMDQAVAGVDMAEARKAAAEASLDQSREQLAYTLVRAPYSGIVTQRHVELGEIAQPGKPLMTGVSLDQLRILVAVPQSMINGVRKQAKARVILPDGQSVEAGKITVFPFADPMSNTFRVRVDLPQELRGVFPGMFVKTAFVLGKKQLLAMPLKALAYRGEVTGVYVQGEEGRLSFRHVRPGRQLSQGRIAILAGLQEGELVVLDPVAAGAELKKQRVESGHGH